jgi:hypothetical protein
MLSQPATNNSNSMRSTVEINRSNNNNHTANLGVTETGAGPDSACGFAGAGVSLRPLDWAWTCFTRTRSGEDIRASFASTE